MLIQFAQYQEVVPYVVCIIDTHMSELLTAPCGCMCWAELLVYVNHLQFVLYPQIQVSEKKKVNILRALPQQVSNSATSIQVDLSLFLNKCEG